MAGEGSRIERFQGLRGLPERDVRDSMMGDTLVAERNCSWVIPAYEMSAHFSQQNFLWCPDGGI